MKNLPKVSFIFLVLEIVLIMSSFNRISSITLGVVVSWLSFRGFHALVPDHIKRFTDKDGRLNPGILITIIWYLMCVFLPILLICRPISFQPLPTLPNESSILKALGINVIFMFASFVGCRLYYRVSKNRNLELRKYHSSFMNYQVTRFILLGLSFVGLVFTAIAFRGDFSVRNLFSGYLGSATSWTRFFSIVFLPLLFHANLLRLSRLIEIRRQNLIFSSCLVIISLLPLIALRLNRAQLVLPLLILAICAFKVGKSIPRLVFSMISLIFVFFLTIRLGDVRSQLLVSQGGRVSLSSAGYTANPAIIDSFQNYFSGPQYMGYALQYIDTQLISALTPIYSIFNPLPLLNSFTLNNMGGSTIYNLSIYGPDVADQYLGSGVEILLAWSVPGVFIFFLLQGYVFMRFSTLGLWNKSLYSRYMQWYLCFWIAAVPIFSISVITQIMFYNFLPAYIIITILNPETKYAK